MTEEKNQSAFFDDVDNLVNYLFYNFGNLSPLKLQKGLYFLFAYYGAIYGKEEKDEELEISYSLPPKLFDENIEAWTYGPVIRSVYYSYNNDEYDPNNLSEEDVNQIFGGNDEVKLFIDEIFSQINKVSDFSLVDRSHEDEAWVYAYEQGKSTAINHEQIIEEYSNKHV